MQTIYSPDHRQHNPPHEFMEGRLTPYTEAPARVEMILQALNAARLGPIMPPRDFGLGPILALHSAEYLEHLQHVYPRWVAAGGAAEAALPQCLPVRGFDRHSPSPLAEVGYYAFDLSAPIVPGTYAAALASANCALTAADLLLNGQQAVYALCRPPGHHAMFDMMGGFCYLNNAAIAAEYLLQAVRTQQPARARLAVLDIDVHHGNGTQALFYERGDVLTVSIHGSPAWEYPYFSGFADEYGQGPGEGTNRNYPLDPGITDHEFLRVLDEALHVIAGFAPGYLVLAAGFDTFAGDPLGKFELTSACYPQIGAQVAALGLPTLVVQEGGYTVAALGQNVVGLLTGLEG